MKISSSDIRRVGDAYFMALDGLGSSTDIVITCDLKGNLPLSLAVCAYRKLIEMHEALQRVKHRNSDTKTWEWKAVPESVWREQMESLCASLEKEGECAEEVRNLCTLPLKLSSYQKTCLEFRVDHTFANGKASYWWLDRYFHVLSESDVRFSDDLSSSIEDSGTRTAAPIWQAAVHMACSAWARNKACFWKKDIRGSFLKRARTSTFSFRTNRIVLSRHQVFGVISRDKAPGESFTQTLTRKLIEHTFRSCIELQTVGIQIAADLHDSCGIELSTIGNFTGLTTGYIDQSRPLEGQVATLFTHIRSGGALGFIKAFSILLKNQARMVAWLKAKFKLVAQKTGDLMLDHLFIVSNLGVVEGLYLCRWVASISLRAMTPHIYVSLSCINDSAVFEFVYPNNTYDERTVEGILSSFFKQFELPLVCDRIHSS